MVAPISINYNCACSNHFEYFHSNIFSYSKYLHIGQVFLIRNKNIISRKNQGNIKVTCKAIQRRSQDFILSGGGGLSKKKKYDLVR
jgi:hypothetical protein